MPSCLATEGHWSDGLEHCCGCDEAWDGHEGGDDGGVGAYEGTCHGHDGVRCCFGHPGRKAMSQWGLNEGAGQAGSGYGHSKCQCLLCGRQQLQGNHYERRGCRGWSEMGNCCSIMKRAKSHSDPRRENCRLKMTNIRSHQYNTDLQVMY